MPFCGRRRSFVRCGSWRFFATARGFVTVRTRGGVGGGGCVVARKVRSDVLKHHHCEGRVCDLVSWEDSMFTVVRLRILFVDPFSLTCKSTYFVTTLSDCLSVYRSLVCLSVQFSHIWTWTHIHSLTSSLNRSFAFGLVMPICNHVKVTHTRHLYLWYDNGPNFVDLNFNRTC